MFNDDIDLSDNCIVNNNYSLPSNNITWTGSGSVYFNSTMTVKNVMAMLPNSIGYIMPYARVWVG